MSEVNKTNENSGIEGRTTNMSSLVILLIMFARGWASPMHTKPPLSTAVCDNPSFLIYPETGWCYKAGVRGPCRAGEVIISSGVGNIGECKYV